MANPLITKKAQDRPLDYTLDGVVRAALMDVSEDMSRYEQFYHWALTCHRDLSWDVLREIKTCKCALTDWMAIKLPSDYVDWTKIGIRKGEMVYTFVHDPTFANQYTDEANPVEMKAQVPAVDPLHKIEVSSQVAYDNVINELGEHKGRMFGAAVKHNGLGYFQVNRKRKEIQLHSYVISKTDPVYMEYICDARDVTPFTVINPYIQNLLKLYIHWQRMEHNDRIPANRTDRAERQYWDEFSRVRTRMFDWSVEEIIDASRNNMHAVKG